MMDNSKLIQGSPEWHEARLAKITGSRFKDVLAKGAGKTRAAYMEELLWERKTGRPAGGFSSPEMEWGKMTEPTARKYYEEATGLEIVQVGFINHPLEQYRKYVGVSPDGLVGDDGCIEIKCLNTENHGKICRKKIFPKAYEAQVQGVLWVTGRKWCDFISFDHRLKEDPYFCVQVLRDEAYIKKLAAAVDEFIQEMVEMQKHEKGVDPQLLNNVTEEVGGCSQKEWDLKQAKAIRGKCIFGYQKSQLEAGLTRKELLEPQAKAEMIELFNFAMTGE